MSTLRVVVPVFPGAQSLDISGPVEVLAGANRSATTTKKYVVEVVSASGGGVRCSSGLELVTAPLPYGGGRIDTLLIPGGEGSKAAAQDEAFVAWIKAAAARSRRVATVCTGAFVAARAGLLDGRTVTTHWASADRLAAEFPSLRVDADRIYINDGRIWTSAGVTAGIDLTLALVQEDHGVDVAQNVARWMVMFVHRPGGQSQFSSPVWVPRAERDSIREVQQIIESDPGGDHRISTLDATASMSHRHFNRVFVREVGITPARFVERVRIELARHALESGSETLDVVASRCGFGTSESLRRAFHRCQGVSPDHYRARFRIDSTIGAGA
jgi:transcriptional regulator GlxA family with amidase domain